MTIINIKGYDVIIDDDIAPLIKARIWHIADRKRGIYFATSVKHPDGKSHDIKLHRFIMSAPPESVVDHIDGNWLDCRRQNLRICTSAENSRNVPMRKSNTTGYKGVNYAPTKGKYRAGIRINGKYKHLGYFDTAAAASDAYQEAAKELFGEFYRKEAIAV
ncbi:HNH endonuclease [Treponema sp. R6D11]